MRGLKRLLFWTTIVGGIGIWMNYAVANGHNPSFWYLSTFIVIVLYGGWIAWMKSDLEVIEKGCYSSSAEYSHYRALQITNNSHASINL